MVLLSSSAVSVILSSGLICLFTFLLFISGYVIQQQTVRSLQEALHPPPMPTATLPVYFQDVIKEKEAQQTVTSEAGAQELLNTVSGESILTASVDEHTATAEPSTVEEKVATESHSTELQNEQPEAQTRLAYVQMLNKPSQICSSLLFFKSRGETGDRAIDHILAYPLIWEEQTSSEPIRTALALMRESKDKFNLKLQAMKVGEAVYGKDMERNMIAHLAEQDWDYDRVLYLRNPGLMLSADELDSALQASKSKPVSSRNWAVASPQASLTPPLLLVSEHGIYSPRGAARRLISKAFTSHANNHEGEMDVETASRTAAYIHFDEGELEHRRTEEEWYGGVFERFERGREEICQGISFDEGKKDLKRVKRSSRIR